MNIREDTKMIQHLNPCDSGFTMGNDRNTYC